MVFARIFLTLLLAFPFLAAASDSFTKGHTVVILVGLPGDLESEKTYTDETVKLLGILNTPALMPKNVILLSNLSALPDFKPGYPLEKIPNERTTFLGIGEKINAASGPPVFILFGHGGTQGNTPVFHVPGPRLIPTDLAAVARITEPSIWLLFFPGSSAFAAEVQGQDRTVLASEAGQVYSQDPISFGLFLDLLKSETDLNRLAAQLGPATDHWYSTRSLARMEEPALWVDGQPPRQLIDSGTTTPASTPASSPATPTSASATNSLAEDDAWKTIHPVDAHDYPQSDAVILSKHDTYLIDDNSEIIGEEETFLQILTREGKRFGDFNFSVSGDEDLTVSASEVRHSDGTIEHLDPDNIHDSTGHGPEGYSVPNEKFFSLPHAEPGAILHVRTQRVWKRFPIPHVFEEVALNAEIPIVSLKVEMSVPEKSAFHFKFCHQAATDPVISRTNYASVYTWQFQNIPAAPQEPLGASDGNPVLGVSTFPDWAAFADWYRRLTRESDNVTPEIEAQARDLVKDIKTDKEKIAAVTQFVTNFRYISIPLGVNSFRPHAATNVLKNRYGDCKDKANLLNTLLKSLGYKTSLVLVPRFAQAYEDLPGFAFNHAIAAVDLNGKRLWIDSTDDVCRIGLLPPGDPGRKVLVVNDPANGLTELPLAAAHDHRLTLQMTARFPDADNRVADVQIAAQTEGYADYLLRSTSKAWSAQAKIAPLLSGIFYPTSGMFEARRQHASDVSDLGQNYSWKAEGAWSGLVSQLPQSTTRLLRLPCWLPKEWPTAMLPRITPLHLNEGYPMEISQTCTVHLPEGVHDLKLPDPQHEDNPVLSWKLSWSQASPSEVDAKLELSLLKADLDPATTQIFQSSCRHLQDSLQDGLSFQVH